MSSLLLRNGALTGQEPLKFAVPDWKEDSQGEMKTVLYFTRWMAPYEFCTT